MNILPFTQLKLEDEEATAMKKYIMNKRRIKTQGTKQRQSMNYCLRGNGNDKAVLLIEKSEDFSTIFTKRKRSEYSGYKQYNLSRSKLILFQNQPRENKPEPHISLRKFDKNIKNVAKLRKKQSQSQNYKSMFTIDEQQRILMNTKNNIKSNGSIEIQDIGQHHFKLKQLLKSMIEKKNFPSKQQLLPQIGEKSTRQSNQSNFNEQQRQFKRYQFQSLKQDDHLDIQIEKNTEIKKKQSQKIEKYHRYRKEKYDKSKKVFHSKSILHPDQDNQLENIELTGWQNQNPSDFQNKGFFPNNLSERLSHYPQLK